MKTDKMITQALGLGMTGPMIIKALAKAYAIPLRGKDLGLGVSIEIEQGWPLSIYPGCKHSCEPGGSHVVSTNSTRSITYRPRYSASSAEVVAALVELVWPWGISNRMGR